MNAILLATTALQSPCTGGLEGGHHAWPSRRALLGGCGLAAITADAVDAAPPPGSVGARMEELKTLGTRVEQSGKAERPAEFWPGRLDGKAPPKPKVVLTDAPPFFLSNRLFRSEQKQLGPVRIRS